MSYIKLNTFSYFFKLEKLLLIYCCIMVSASVFGASRNYPVFKKNGKIILDGNPFDKAWDTAPWANYFFPVFYKRGQLQKTKFKMLHDNKNLYVLLQAYEKYPDKLRGKKTFGGKFSWSQDLIEVYLMPEESKKYFRLGINAFGNVSNPELKAAAKLVPSGYIIECVIPYKVFKYNKADRKNIFTNIGRSSLTGSSCKYSCWSTCSFLFKETENFGKLVIIDYSPKINNITKIQHLANLVFSPEFLSNANFNLNFYKEILNGTGKGNLPDGKNIFKKWRRNYKSTELYIKQYSELPGKMSRPDFWINACTSSVKYDLNFSLVSQKAKLTDAEKQIKYKSMLEQIVK